MDSIFKFCWLDVGWVGGEKKENDFTQELISDVKNSQGNHMIDTQMLS